MPRSGTNTQTYTNGTQTDTETAKHAACTCTNCSTHTELDWERRRGSPLDWTREERGKIRWQEKRRPRGSTWGHMRSEVEQEELWGRRAGEGERRRSRVAGQLWHVKGSEKKDWKVGWREIVLSRRQTVCWARLGETLSCSQGERRRERRRSRNKVWRPRAHRRLCTSASFV